MQIKNISARKAQNKLSLPKVSLGAKIRNRYNQELMTLAKYSIIQLTGRAGQIFQSIIFKKKNSRESKMLSIGSETASVAKQKLKIVSEDLCTEIRAEFEHFIKEESTSGTLPSKHDVYVKAIMRFGR